MKVGYFLLAFGIGMVLSPNRALAANTSLQLRILPIDCVFEVVNDGSNEIHYITSEACGQFMPSPSQVTNASTNDTDNSRFFNYPFSYILQPENQNNTSSIIYLNDFTDYLEDSGKTLNLSVGQVVYFGLSNNGAFEKHSITLKEIGTDYIIITIASTPFDAKIYIGETKQFDVTQDDKNDIEVTLNSIINKTANITFKQLSVAEGSLKLKQDQQNFTQKPRYWLIGTILLLAIILYTIKNYKIKRNKN